MIIDERWNGKNSEGRSHSIIEVIFQDVTGGIQENYENSQSE
jgi:hypothetical protein